MSSRDARVSICTRVCVCGHVCAAETRREDRTSQTCSTGQCMSYVRSHVELEFVKVCVCAHIHVFKCTHMFLLTTGEETDNQEGREPGSVCTSAVGRDHRSQRFAKIISA